MRYRRLFLASLDKWVKNHYLLHALLFSGRNFFPYSHVPPLTILIFILFLLRLLNYTLAHSVCVHKCYDICVWAWSKWVREGKGWWWQRARQNHKRRPQCELQEKKACITDKPTHALCVTKKMCRQVLPEGEGRGLNEPCLHYLLHFGTLFFFSPRISKSGCVMFSFVFTCLSFP